MQWPPERHWSSVCSAIQPSLKNFSSLELEAQMRLRGESRAVMSYAVQSAVEQETLIGLPNSF